MKLACLWCTPNKKFAHLQKALDCSSRAFFLGGFGCIGSRLFWSFFVCVAQCIL